MVVVVLPNNCVIESFYTSVFLPVKWGWHCFFFKGYCKRDKVCKMPSSINCIVIGTITIISVFTIKYKNWAWSMINSRSMEDHVTSLLHSGSHSKCGDTNQQLYYLETHSRLYLTENKL